MRVILVMVVVLSAAAAKAQTFLSPGFAGSTAGMGIANNIYNTDSLSKKTWSLTKYSGISTSFNFFRGGTATIVSAPIGLQLNRRLNNNLYAFANIAVAPAYVNFNQSFIKSYSNKTGPTSLFSGRDRFGLYSSASMGLMYINDEKTFSISGSIGVERSSNPFIPISPTRTAAPNPVSRTHK